MSRSVRLFRQLGVQASENEQTYDRGDEPDLAEALAVGLARKVLEGRPSQRECDETRLRSGAGQTILPSQMEAPMEMSSAIGAREVDGGWEEHRTWPAPRSSLSPGRSRLKVCLSLNDHLLLSSKLHGILRWVQPPQDHTSRPIGRLSCVDDRPNAVRLP